LLLTVVGVPDSVDLITALVCKAVNSVFATDSAFEIAEKLSRNP
jgi:hypothetical protein